jgi:hypothetical protein
MIGDPFLNYFALGISRRLALRRAPKASVRPGARSTQRSDRGVQVRLSIPASERRRADGCYR